MYTTTVGGKIIKNKDHYTIMDTKLFDSLTRGCFEERFFAYMKAVGLNLVTVVYSGGGDSGGMDYVEFDPAVNDKIKDGIKNDLEEQLCNPIYSRHGSFADGGGYYVNGQVVYDSNTHTVNISGTDHITTYTYAEGLEDEEADEETREEDWEECVYSKPSKGFSDKSIDCLFAYLYARDFLDNKLPEDLHNKMIAEASINEDEHAIKYMIEIK